MLQIVLLYCTKHAVMKRLIICLLCLTTFYSASGQSLDLRLLEHINGPVSSSDQTWRDVSTSTYFAITVIPATMLITGLAEHDKELTVKSFEVGGSIALASISTVILKDITNRERPYLAHPKLITGKASEPGSSFPSLHSSAAFATATSLSLSFPKWYVIAPSFAYAATVGYSRMYLGVHYPSDVAAGALIGAGSSFLTWELQKLLNKKYHYH